jgi:hypothetical protein
MKFRFFPALFSLLLILGGCGIGRQIQELRNFANCEFRLRNMENTTLAGVNVQQVQSLSDLNLAQAAQVTSAYARGSLPLNLVLNVEARNPNESTASMNQLEWIMLIDDKEIVNGLLDERVAISPDGGISNIPLRISVDLLKALPNTSREEALNMGLGLAGASGRPTRVSLRVRPTILMGNTPLRYPGYITVSQEFSSR